MIRGFIIGHCDIGKAVVGALDSITGKVEGIHFFSNDGLSTKDLAEIIRDTAKESDERVVIFVDVYGGSCWRAAKQARLPNSFIITGLNLPMLLSFINKRDDYPFEDLPAILEHDAKRGIVLE